MTTKDLQLKTALTTHSASYAIVIQGLLEAHCFDVYLFDDNIIWVHPFYANAVGGIRLMIPSDQFEDASFLLEQDQSPYYRDHRDNSIMENLLESAFEHSQRKIEFRAMIRKDTALLDQPNKLEELGKDIEPQERRTIIMEERWHKRYGKLRPNFSWSRFWDEVFDPHRDVWRYLQGIPVTYHLEKEWVANNDLPLDTTMKSCPNCNSENVYYGIAIDFGWDIIPLIVFFTIFTPLFPIRSKYHCFDCGHNFK